MMNGYDGHGWGMGWGMGWWWIIGLIILVAVIWMLVKTRNKSNSLPSGPGKSALDILKDRYAKGEMDKKEFEDRKMDLM